MIVYSFYRADWLMNVSTILLYVGILAGAYGTIKHIRGVGQRVDGYKLRNFLIGPPLTLPAFVSAVSVLGLIALHWG